VKRGRIQSKKGQGLPMNTVIITILVILVLVVVAAFFLGGTSNLVTKIREIFYGSISGTDRTFASGTCQQRCDQLQILPKSQLGNSAYCQDYFNIDSDNDGEADYTGTGKDKVYTRYYCYESSGTLAPGTQGPTQRVGKSLDVGCPIEGINPEQYCITPWTTLKPQPQ
tara:strand:+ start:1922 stop:2425 length:504 start_codon:yes stop_codon:yes gene_type:complete